MSESEPTRRRGIVFPSRAAASHGLPEVIEFPFPDRRTIHWVPPDLAMTDGFSIVITSEILLQTSRHVASTLESELGGFLLGNRCRCPNTGREYITIDQYVEAEYTESTDVSLTFTHESWARLDSYLTGKHYGKKLVGWYHSHPTMSIFLSEADLALHRERFKEHWMVALVLEPEKHIGGFFVWKNGRIDPNRYVNFYELLDGEARQSVVAWKNYHGVDPLHSTTPAISSNNTQSGPEQAFTLGDATPDPGAPTEDQNSQPVKPQRGLPPFRAVMIFGMFILLCGAAYYGYNRWQQPQIVSVEKPPVPLPLLPHEQPTPETTPSPSPTTSTDNKKDETGKQRDDDRKTKDKQQPKRNKNDRTKVRESRTDALVLSPEAVRSWREKRQYHVDQINNIQDQLQGVGVKESLYQSLMGKKSFHIRERNKIDNILRRAK